MCFRSLYLKGLQTYPEVLRRQPRVCRRLGVMLLELFKYRTQHRDVGEDVSIPDFAVVEGIERRDVQGTVYICNTPFVVVDRKDCIRWTYWG